jgi:hypothetical protein
MPSAEKLEKGHKFAPPSREAFECKQIDLFQFFVCNNDEQKESLSNAFPLWDCLPRYALSRRAAEKLRKDGELPSVLKLNCQYLGQNYEIVIQPARLLDAQGNVTEYYPSSSEELIEDALRKISTIQHNGFFEQTSEPRSGVSFTIYQLRKELENQGHTRSYQQIVLGLQILANSIIRIKTENKKQRGFVDSPYFRQLACVSRIDLIEDPDARWYVEFHPLITQAISAIDYRQFNYALMMSHSTHLARWLHKYLVIKFTYAQVGKTFEIRFSTIRRDSSLLENYARQRDAVKSMSDALDELKIHGLLISINEKKIVGPRKQIEDVIYTLTPTAKFSAEVKAANKRLSDASTR